jgi:hypothetical protein
MSAVFARRIATVAVLAFTGVACGLDKSPSGVQTINRGTTIAAANPTPDLSSGALTSSDVAADGSVVPLDELRPLPRFVAVIGDSLALSAADEIRAALLGIGLDDVVIDSVESRRIIRRAVDIPPGIDAIRQLQVGSTPDLWVISLGTNDVASQLGIDVIRSNIAELLALIPADDPVVWVDVWLRDDTDQAAAANVEIRRLVGRRPVSAVVDWFSWGLKDDVISRDGVHLTERGQNVFAAAIARTVDSLFAD